MSASSSRWVEQLFLALEGEQEQVDHAEGGVVGSQGRSPGGVADDGGPAAFDGAVEGLGDESGADAGEAGVVELGFAEDVEPQRGVFGEVVPFGVGELVEDRAAVALKDLRSR